MDWSYPGTVTSAEFDGKHAEDVLDKLGKVDFKFRLTNPNDVVRGYLYLFDDADVLVFFGYEEFKLADFEAGNTTFEVWMQDVPMLSGVASAEVLALMPDGTTSPGRYALEVVNGHVLFKPWMAGAENGLLVVKFNDGTLTTYSLSSPTGNSPEATVLNGSMFSISGHYILKDPESIKILELWARPTVFLELTASKTITVDVIGILQKGSSLKQEHPSTAEVTDTATGDVYSFPLKADGTSSIQLPDGEYRIRFTWIEFGEAGLLYTGPSDGGKG
jgi:hypothetical protein